METKRIIGLVIVLIGILGAFYPILTRQITSYKDIIAYFITIKFGIFALIFVIGIAVMAIGSKKN
ncbi:hypothetical protein HYV81_00290 [Candidatus Woesearchaeota archaeon]|nr:hypothetical protein [Candidatus Woesearchaeota archaeon]